MGYKVPISVLEGFKKALENSNKVLTEVAAKSASNGKEDKIVKQMKANDKQIKLIEDEFYIGKKSDIVFIKNTCFIKNNLVPL